LFVAADQRGFLNENTTYSGYSSTTPCVDSGAVQTNYTAVQFVVRHPTWQRPTRLDKRRRSSSPSRKMDKTLVECR